jgi:tubulin beta
MVATFIGNKNAFRKLFTRVDGQPSKMYARRAFIDWYVNGGLETVEFDEAHSNTTDLIQKCEMDEAAGVDEAGVAEKDTDDAVSALTHLIMYFSLMFRFRSP